MFFTEQEFRLLAHPAGLDTCPRCGGRVERRDLGLRPPVGNDDPPPGKRITNDGFSLSVHDAIPIAKGRHNL